MRRKSPPIQCAELTADGFAEVRIPGKGKKASKGNEAARTKKPRNRRKPGVAALKEIRTQQKLTTLCIRKLPFQRLCRGISDDAWKAVKLKGTVDAGNLRWEASAIEILQEVSEVFMIDTFAMTNRLAVSPSI